MKRPAISFTATLMMGLALGFSSCQSDDEPFLSYDSTPANIQVKSDGVEEVVGFDLSKSFIIRETYDDGEYDGLSWLNATSGGIKVDDAFWLSLYFPKIDNIKEGSVLKPEKCYFGFVFSSLGSNHTEEYDGKFILKEKGSDYAIIYFDNVVFHVTYGDCNFNGELKLPLLDKYPWPEE